jgi:hypothetical protein
MNKEGHELYGKGMYNNSKSNVDKMPEQKKLLETQIFGNLPEQDRNPGSLN